MSENVKMEHPIEPGGITDTAVSVTHDNEKLATEREDKNDISNDGTATSTSQTPNADEESLEARLERLGRARPECFKSTWQEAGFVFSIAMSQVLAVLATPPP